MQRDPRAPTPVVATTIFVLFTIAGMIMIFASRNQDPFIQSVLQHLGAALFSSGLTSFIVLMVLWSNRTSG
jgi:hypothetical protein